MLLYTIPAQAELIAVDQYLSIKLGYTGVMGDPVKIKGTSIVPTSGYEKKSFISTPNLSFAVGTYYATEYVAIRGETEYVIRFNSGSKVATIPTGTGNHKFTLSTMAQTLLLNLFLDFNTRTFFVPYIGAGIGAVFLDTKYTLDTVSKKKSIIDFSWQVSIGGAFYIVPSLALDIQARYSSLGSIRSGSGIPMRVLYNPTAIDVFVGIRYTL